jgi:uncharacterized metal-binding protein
MSKSDSNKGNSIYKRNRQLKDESSKVVSCLAAVGSLIPQNFEKAQNARDILAVDNSSFILGLFLVMIMSVSGS